MEALTGIVQNPLFGLIGVALAVASLVLTYVFYRKSRRMKEPSWAITSKNLVQGYSTTMPYLAILYRDQKVENLTISKILFWNKGTATIDRADIAPADPLRVVGIGEVKLLDAKVLQTNSEPSLFSASLAVDGRTALLQFDFLDQNQGAVVQVIHSGTSSGDLQVMGTIKGSGTPKETMIRRPLPAPFDLDRKLKPVTRRRISVFFYTLSSTMLFLMSAPLLVLYFTPDVVKRRILLIHETFPSATSLIRIAPLLIGLLGIIAVAFLGIGYVRSASIPYGLVEAFEEDI